MASAKKTDIESKLEHLPLLKRETDTTFADPKLQKWIHKGDALPDIASQLMIQTTCRIVYYCPSPYLASRCRSVIMDLIVHSQPLDVFTRYNEEEIWIKNGSRVVMIHARTHALRGVTADVVLIDGNQVLSEHMFCQVVVPLLPNPNQTTHVIWKTTPFFTRLSFAMRTRYKRRKREILEEALGSWPTCMIPFVMEYAKPVCTG
jgi:hypothetical protein